MVQNKLHYAITGQTAVEVIADRADAMKENMGLTSWKGEKIRKGIETNKFDKLSWKLYEKKQRG